MTCHDCGVEEGQLHEWGCDVEVCPFCGRQLISCDCVYDLLGIRNPMLWSAASAYLPPFIYEHGLTADQEYEWHVLLTRKGRYPYVEYSMYCARCGCDIDEMFMVPDEEWRGYVDPREWRSLLCRPCYEKIKEWTIAARERAGR